MSKIYVISGGPSVGKTTIVKALEKEFKILPEAARLLAETDSRFKGKSINSINKKEFQSAIFYLQKEQLENFSGDVVFTDRGFGDTLAYFKLAGVEIPKEILEYSKKFRYAKIFILDPMSFYVKDDLRQESKEEAKEIHEEIIKSYKELDYEVVNVPDMSVKDRVNFIKERR